MHRLRQRHSRHLDTPPADGHKLLAEQRLRAAAIAGTVTALLMVSSWVAIGMLFDRYFPWYSVLAGYLIGHAVRRYGHGVDWHYPALAAGLTSVAAFAGSFVVALFLTGREFGTGALELVDEISWYTLRVFAGQNFGVDGVIYMVFGAMLAAFFSTRRLDRQQAIALRRQRERDS